MKTVFNNILFLFVNQTIRIVAISKQKRCDIFFAFFWLTEEIPLIFWKYWRCDSV